MGGKLNFLLLTFLILGAFSCNKEIPVEDVQSETYVKLFGGSTLDIAKDVIVTDEYTAITGAMNTADKGTQAFVIFTDKFGNEINSVLVGNGLNDIGNCIFKTTDGNLIMVGTQSVTGLNTDILVTKISVSGAVLWSFAFGGAGKEEGFFGMELSTGGYVVGGYTESSGYGLKDIYMLKLDANGNEVSPYSTTKGAQNNEIGYDIAELNGFIYIVGSTESYGVTNKKVYVVKVDPSNNWQGFSNLYGTNVAYAGIKICNLPENKLLVMGSDGTNSTYLNCINSDLNTSYWDKEFISTSGEHYNDVFFGNSQLFLCGVSHVNQHADIYIRRIDQAAGNDIGTSIFPSGGDQELKAGFLGADGRVSVVGSNTLNGLSQIFLIKKGL
jgi:hypothetical protein